MWSNKRDNNPNHRLLIFSGLAGFLLLMILAGPTLDIYKAQVDPTQQQLELLQTTVAALLNPRVTLTSRAFELQTATIVARRERTNAVVQTNVAATNAFNYTVTVLVQTATLTPSNTATPAIDATQQFNTLMWDVAQRFTATSAAQLTQTATVGYAYTVNSIILRTLGITATNTPSATYTPTLTATPSETSIPSETPLPTGTATLVPKEQTIESNSLQVRRTGQWTVFQSDFASGGNFMTSDEQATASLTLTFRGTAVDVIYLKAPQLGLFAIEIDGKWVETIDSNASKPEFNIRTKIRDLKMDTHRLRVYTLRGAVAIDAFIVQPQSG